MTTNDLYLSYLRRALWGEPEVKDVSDADWQALMLQSLRQGTAPLVYNEVLKEPDTVPEKVSAQMRQTCGNTMLREMQLLQGLRFTFDTLIKAGIHPVLLKGFGLAALYPTPYLRSWGDLDVYVGPEQYHAAAAVLRQAFPQAKHHDEEWDELKHYNFVLPDGSLIEMHRRTMAFFSERDKRYFFGLEDEAMQHTEPIEAEGYTIHVPEHKFNMLFVFMHAWEHFYETGAGMKHFADVAMLAHRLYHDPACDKSELKGYLYRHLRKMRMLHPWRMMGYVIVRYLGLPKEEWMCYDESSNTCRYGERLYERVMAEGMAREKDFGDSRDRYEARDKAMALPVWKRKWLTVKSKVKECTPMWQFAPAYTLHRLTASLWHGVKRTLKGEKMILY